MIPLLPACSKPRSNLAGMLKIRPERMNAMWAENFGVANRGVLSAPIAEDSFGLKPASLFQPARLDLD